MALDKMTIWYTNDDRYYFRSIRRWGHHTLVLIGKNELYAKVLFETPNGKVFETVRAWLAPMSINVLLEIAEDRERRNVA